jgi:hypothetical protein
MADPRRLSDSELEGMVRNVGSQYPYPPTPNLASTVRSRIEVRAAARAVPLPIWRDPWRLALAAAVLLIVLGAAVLINPVTRDAIAHFFHVRGVVVTRVQSPLPTVQPTTSPYLGVLSDLEQAQAAVAFKIVVPPDLGPPDAVYLDTAIPGGEVALAYKPRPGIPLVKQTGWGLLVTEFRGDLAGEALLKEAGPGTRVDETTVNGNSAWWLQGEPHILVIDESGRNRRPETLRLATNTLVWEHEGVTYRIEADLAEADAKRIAAGMP